jgi:hypothetical protein
VTWGSRAEQNNEKINHDYSSIMKTAVRVAARVAVNNAVEWPFREHSTIWRLDVEMDVRWPKIAFSAIQKPAEFLVDVQ